jgi:hypothetical protein
MIHALRVDEKAFNYERSLVVLAVVQNYWSSKIFPCGHAQIAGRPISPRKPCMKSSASRRFANRLP